MQENPLLNRLRLPGETFRLPSQGLFYTDGELSPDVKDGEVHIYPMTTIDEIVIRSPDKLYSGEAISEVFSRCIPQILKPTELFTKDVDFLMVCLRRLSYGDSLSVNFKHTCDDAKVHEYPISMDGFIRQCKRIDPTTISSNYSITMENGQVVLIRPLRYSGYISIMQQNTNADIQSPEDMLRQTMNTLINVIYQVDDITDKSQIIEWLSKIPTGWGNVISKAIDGMAEWGIDFVINTKCADCDEDIKLPIPANPISFFM
jgi:hypothetical protein